MTRQTMDHPGFPLFQTSVETSFISSHFLDLLSAETDELGQEIFETLDLRSHVMIRGVVRYDAWRREVVRGSAQNPPSPKS